MTADTNQWDLSRQKLFDAKRLLHCPAQSPACFYVDARFGFGSEEFSLCIFFVVFFLSCNTHNAKGFKLHTGGCFSYSKLYLCELLDPASAS